MGEWKEYRGSKIANTQEVIYDLIGVNDFEIKLLSYFSAKDPTLFGTIGKADRYSLISTISGISEIEEIKAKLSNEISTKTRDISFLNGKIATLENNRKKSKTDLALMVTKRDSQVTSDLEKLRRELKTCQQVLSRRPPFISQTKELEELYTAYKVMSGKSSYSKNAIHIAKIKEKSLSDEIITTKASLSSVLEGKCPTCGQNVSNDKLTKGYMNTLTEIKVKLPLIQSEIISETEKVETLERELEANERQRTEIRDSLEDTEGLEAEIKVIQKKIDEITKDHVNHEPLIAQETSRIEEFNAEITAEEAKRYMENQLVQAMHWVKDVLLKRNGLLATKLAEQAQNMLQEQVDLLTRDEKFKVMVHNDLSISGEFLGRDEEAYEQLSTGQARVVDTVMLVALNNLFTSLYGMDSGVLGVVVFDEVLSFLNEKYIDLCYNIVQKTRVPKRIVITHDPRLINKFDSHISVTLSGKASSVYKKSW